MNHTVSFLLLLTMPLVSQGADSLPVEGPQKKSRPLPTYQVGLAPILQVSTAGFGVGVAHSISRHFAARAGINLFNYQGIYNAGKDTDDLQLAFDYSFKLTSINLLLDYYPFRRLGFRLTAGTYFNRNRFSLFGQSTKDFKFNDVVFTVKDIGTIEGTARFQRFAPYAGIGWGHPFLRKRLKLMVDLGMFFQNSPKIDFRTTGMLAPSSDQGAVLEDNLKPLKYYPIFNIGLAYRLKTNLFNR